MPERSNYLTDEELKRSLSRLGPRVDFPKGARLARAVHDRLESSRPSFKSRIILAWPRPALYGAAAVLWVALVAGTLLISPIAREAVADLLGLRGVGIRYGETPPAPKATSPDLGLGERVTLNEAISSASFRVSRPTLPELAQPDEIFFSDEITDGQVAFLYAPSATLPPTTNPRVGLLFTQFLGSLQQDLMGKVVGSGTRLEQVVVQGIPGVWLEGNPHHFFYVDEEGKARQETIRLAGNTLLWERNGITFRLESALEKADVLRIAASVQ